MHILFFELSNETRVREQSVDEYRCASEVEALGILFDYARMTLLEVAMVSDRRMIFLVRAWYISVQ